MTPVHDQLSDSDDISTILEDNLDRHALDALSTCSVTDPGPDPTYDPDPDPFEDIYFLTSSDPTGG